MRGECVKKTECAKTTGNQTIMFKNPPYINGAYSVAGRKEGEGPLGKSFHRIVDDEYFGETTHEYAEQKMLEAAITGAIKNSKIPATEIDIMFAGDLINQITPSSFAARSFDMSYVGIYGACSTMALTLAVASSFVSAGHFSNVIAAAGSHFGTAERQYRFPLELGSQKPPASQWTVTGTGSCVVSTKPNSDKSPRITAVTFGKVRDFGINDVNNMGAAMAPAAAATLIAHMVNTNRTPDYYDAIFTGDLGRLGEEIMRDLCANANYPLTSTYTDCGRMMFSQEQQAYQGGSGCGCAASVFCGFIMNKLKRGEYRRVLLIATGALLSPVSSFQGNTIPGIAHAVAVEAQ
jgi:stage V sporulation protein AD